MFDTIGMKSRSPPSLPPSPSKAKLVVKVKAMLKYTHFPATGDGGAGPLPGGLSAHVNQKVATSTFVLWLALANIRKRLYEAVVVVLNIEIS